MLEMTETKEPLISYCPRVRATIGPLVEEWNCSRSCVYPKHIFSQRHMIEKFEIFFDGVTVEFNLKDGSVWLCPSGASRECQMKSKLPHGTKYKLIWYRKMGGQLHEWDKNTKPPELLFYGVGWEATVAAKVHKFGYTIDPQGEFSMGLPDNAPV